VFDHVGFPVADVARRRAFYGAELAPLGFAPVMDIAKEQTGGYEGTGFGPPGRPQLWIGSGGRHAGTTHIAFTAGTRALVDAFYKAAIRRRRARQRRTGTAPALPRQLLRRVRARSGRLQHRSRLPLARLKRSCTETARCP
jgi:catechol 2,3-dioxygenase-like lactoylglutathione lyase family enzyme